MFLHPWAVVIAVFAVGLPVAIHFLTRPRPVPMPLSTLRFLREAVQQRRARHRLRDWIVLVLRTLAVLLIALAVARPRLGRQPLVSDADTGSTLRVVILDASQSTAAITRGIQALERARTIAAAHLRYRPGLRGNLIVAGARPRPVFDAPSQNFEALRDALDRVQVLPERLDVNRTLALAAEMLVPRSADDRRRRELVVVSDFQRSNWARADFSALPQDTQLQFESVAAAETPANLAILGAQVRGRPTQGVPAQLEIEVGNYSPAAQRVTVEILVGDATLRMEGLCPAGRRTTLAQDVTLASPGWHTGVARLAGVADALAADDSRGVAIEVGDQPLFALVTRQPASQRPSASHFLECALVPDAKVQQQASARLVRIDPSNVDRQQLSAADVIALDHPGKLSSESIVLLAGLLRRGQPVLYVAAEPIDAVNLLALAEAAGTGLKMPVEFAPLPSGQARTNAFLTAVRHDSAPFRVFGESAPAVVRQLRFSGGLSTRRLQNALDDDLLATYSDGTACLVVTSSDAGALAVLNADLGRSSLPRTEAFVPLVDELLSHLLQRGRASFEAVCGEPLVARLPLIEAASALKIVGPEPNDGLLGELADEGAGLVWRWSAPSPPGVYRVERDGHTEFALPIGLAAEESQLESLPAEVLTNRLAAGRAAYFRSAASADTERDTLWTWLAVACVLCLVGELTALIGFRS